MAAGKVVVVDGNSLLYRAFFALPSLTTADGTPTNAVYGFTMMLFRLLEEERPDVILIAQERGRTFRHDQFDQYKSQRPSTPPDLVVQAALARQVAEVMRIPQVEAPGFEADDLVGTIACRAKTEGWEVLIVTGDLDALQLVDERVRVMVNRRGLTDTMIYDREAVRDRFGLAPEQLPDFKALKGDPSDNIPGVPGIGEKTAAKLIAEHGSLEALLDGIEEMPSSRLRDSLRESRQKALQYKALSVIICDVPVETPFDAWRYAGPDAEAARELFTRLEFRTLVRRLPGSEAPPGSGEPICCRRLEENEDTATLAGAARRSGAVALRFAWNGTSARRGEVTGLGLAWGDEAVCLGSDEALAGEAGAQGSLLEAPAPWRMPSSLRALLADPDVRLAGHDTKADLHALGAADGNPRRTPAFDTMLAAYVLNPGRSSYRLEDLAQENLGLEVGEGGGRIERAGREAVAVLRLWGPMAARVVADELERVLYELELPLVPILVEMEAHGLLVDAAALAALSARLGERLAELQSEIFRHAGREFNIGSPKQLQVVLFEELGLQAGRRTRTGLASTSVEVLEELAAGNPIVGCILEYRELAKLKSTYADALAGLRDPATGRVHTQLNQTVAATGRLSSSEPNVQNIPIRTEIGREIRKAFVAPPGRLLLSADYSQIELRILAHATGDPALVQAFREEEDIHSTTAARVFNVSSEAVTPDLRRRGKTLNFAVIYGMSDFGLARSLAIPVNQAHDLIEAYFARFPGVRRYTEETIRQARDQGYVTTLPPYRRRRYIPGIRAGNRNERLNAERAAVNAPIQGTAADIIKLAMIRIDAALRERRLRSRLVLQVHDELLFESVPEERAQLVPLVTELMEGAAALDVPLRVDVKVGHNWRDMEAVGM